MSQQLPAIVSDIDGVLYSGDQIKGNSTVILTEILTRKFGNSTLPFLLLTNSGGLTEKAKAENLNKRLKINKISEEHVVLSHTPYGDLVPKYTGKVILVVATQGSMTNLAENYGFDKYITLEEFAAVYPDVSYFVHTEYTEKQLQQFKDTVMARFEIGEEGLDHFSKTLKISAIMVMSSLSQEGLCCQIFSDLLSSKNGNVFGERRKEANEPQMVDLYFSNNDLVYAANWHQPRFGPGAFTIYFKTIFKELNGFEPEITYCGKPFPITYEFAQRKLEQICDLKDVTISNFWMIGDNTQSDIEGVNRQKKLNQNSWKSILVKTGVWKEGDDTNGADFVVGDLEEAYRLILEKEGLK